MGRLDPYPLARRDAACRSGCRMQLHLGIAGKPPQARQRAMLAFTEESVLGTGKDQGVAFGQIGVTRSGAAYSSLLCEQGG